MLDWLLQLNQTGVYLYNIFYRSLWLITTTWPMDNYQDNKTPKNNDHKRRHFTAWAGNANNKHIFIVQQKSCNRFDAYSRSITHTYNLIIMFLNGFRSLKHPFKFIHINFSFPWTMVMLNVSTRLNVDGHVIHTPPSECFVSQDRMKSGNSFIYNKKSRLCKLL